MKKKSTTINIFNAVLEDAIRPKISARIPEMYAIIFSPLKNITFRLVNRLNKTFDLRSE